MVVLLLLLAACTGPADDTGDSSDTGEACAGRAGGAMIELDVAGQGIRLWLTDPTFIDGAIAHVAAGTTQVPNFGAVVAGTDCDERYGFHVDPAQAEWADFTIELCDGTPEYVDAHLDEWIASVGQWCPWAAVPTAVDDRR